MTMRHVIDGLMQKTRAKSHNNLAFKLMIDSPTISRLHKGQNLTVSMEKLERMQAGSQVSFDTIFEWYRLPEGAVLGRVA